MSKIASRFSRRSLITLWTVLVGIVIGAFIYFEQISLLYVLATLGLVLLLLIVAFADLEKVGFDAGD